ncbi:MAG: ATP-dependent DNA helicase RecG [Pseudomonadota bacterium]
MRPDVLFPLFADVAKLSGVGPNLKACLERLKITRVADLLWHLPSGVIDRRPIETLETALVGSIVTIDVTIGMHEKAPSSKAPWRIFASDDLGRQLQLVYFSAKADYLSRLLPEGGVRRVSGTVEAYGSQLQMVHPDYVATLEQADTIPVVEPVYPLTQGLTLKRLSGFIAQALERMPALEEWIEPTVLSQKGCPHWRDALLAVHRPQDAQPRYDARARLAYDELFANQLTIAILRRRARARRGRAFRPNGALQSEVLSRLPFSPTAAQTRAVEEISADMAQESVMTRLLQGDVGSGKTLVALMAMLNAVESGAQAVLLAPTEILARQHGQTLAQMLQGTDVTLAVLTGRDKGAGRRETLAQLESGDINILVGTHAVFQDSVAYKDLGLVVIDEQHRFGVHQRLMMSRKGRIRPDLLVMTATPIPRTLTLAAYGEMAVSKLDEKPPGRQPIDTRVVPMGRVEDVVSALRRALGEGAQVYWVCPLVEESELTDQAAAEARHAYLERIFPGKVGLVHGRMPASEKDAAMSAFLAGDSRILVATTVIEVGVDVPNATIIVIEEAERFGLAQLHQLRGRVGRGRKKSVCLLLRGESLSETAQARLRILRESEDGFRIAEEDLRLRGSGEILGTRQSGLPQFRLANLDEHQGLLQVADDDARYLLEVDPGLDSPRGQAARTLLYLMERDDAVRLLDAG